jgi:transposase
MVHFVIEAVERVELYRFRINERGTGSAQYPPRMMLALLVYCYANGIFSSRRIERATYRDVAVRYVTGDTHPDHDTIARFRRENFDAVSECFVTVLLLARELGLLKVGTVSTDGTQIRANASKHKSVTYERAGELVEELKLDVAELLAKAEDADNTERDEGQQLPKEIARREKLQAKLEAARERLEVQAKAKAESEQTEYLHKVKAREQRKGRSKGKKIKPPKEHPDADKQINLTDADSQLMRKNTRSSYEQCYNAQATVDADGSQLVLNPRVTRCASDRNELVANIEGIPETVGKPEAVLADSAYACEEQVMHVQSDGVDAYVSTGAEARQMRRRYDLRPPSKRSETKKEPKAPWLLEMRSKLETDTGRALYALRKQTVEPVFGIVKDVMGFRQFLLRGLQKVEGEWQLVTLAYNVKRLWNLKMAL